MAAHGAPAAVVALALLAGCGTARPVTYGVTACVSWQEDVSPKLDMACAGCHSAANPEGSYIVTDYLDALTDQHGNVVAAEGDANSLLLRTLDPVSADATHSNFASLFPLVRQWVVGCRLSYFQSPFHPGGILNPADSDFHGKLVQREGWNLSLCASCHGSDFGGGLSGASCLTCHKGGPTSCTTCHAEPPATGAHLAHATGALARPFDCVECHVKPQLYTDVGHLFTADGSVITTPIITFGALAAASFAPVPRAGPPAWDATTGACSNVYCHGGAFADSAATNRAPLWSGGQGQASCGTCHGVPPSDHTSALCSQCHSLVVDESRAIIDRSRHVDGLISLGDESGTCSACHGGPAGPAPPRDLDGHLDPSFVGVGAHTAHLLAPHRLSVPVPCAACHLVPAQLNSPGHLDGTPGAEVFPPALAPTSAAFDDGAAPVWDRAAERCENVYCHGGGTRLRGDGATSVNRTPGWTLGSSQAECGACHGVPPVDGSHNAAMTLSTCANCHATTVDATGTILFTNQATTHMNGVVDVTP